MCAYLKGVESQNPIALRPTLNWNVKHQGGVGSSEASDEKSRARGQKTRPAGFGGPAPEALSLATQGPPWGTSA